MQATIKKLLGTILPPRVFAFLLGAYHFLFSWAAALWYGLPARKMFVIGVTGTKGKSSTVEMMNAILEEAGFRTAVASTIRFKIDTDSSPNLFKMTMPGHGYLQRFLARAKERDCTHAVIEITSEGARQFRNSGIALNALIFTNIAPEHIESHGSYDNYKKAKLAIGQSLVRSRKRPRCIVANVDDELGKKFLELPVETKLPFSLKDAEPYKTLDTSVSMTFAGTSFGVAFPGSFTILNALASATLAKALGIPANTIARALSQMTKIAGRTEMINCGQEFFAVVDYAHTPDSLRALYGAFPHSKKICVLGNTGGGRDRWKRPEMGKIAEEMCSSVILTNEDPYDENPTHILEEMAKEMKKAPRIILDRREAIHQALAEAAPGDVVLITGKGTDPFIMEANGAKKPWSDAGVVREELEKLMRT